MEEGSPPFFSILTATLNVRETIPETLTSVNRQSFDGVEHLVMDGGSTDGTHEVLRPFESSYDLKWFSRPDSGIAEALNKGLELSRGRYILVLHGDDKLVHDNILYQVHSMLEREEVDIYAFPVILCSRPGEQTLMKPIQTLWWHRFKTIFLHQGAFVHQRVFDKVGGFREKFKIALDYDFFYRALNSGVRMKFERPPVAIMGGKGLSARHDLLDRRLSEEKTVQLDNESALFWKMAQILFWSLYGPYKRKISPRKFFRPG